MLARMLKHCEASRGHISRLRSTGLYISEPAMPRNTPLGPLHINMQGPELLRALLSSDVFNLLCWYPACLCTGNG